MADLNDLTVSIGIEWVIILTAFRDLIWRESGIP